MRHAPFELYFLLRDMFCFYCRSQKGQPDSIVRTFTNLKRSAAEVLVPFSKHEIDSMTHCMLSRRSGSPPQTQILSPLKRCKHFYFTWFKFISDVERGEVACEVRPRQCHAVYFTVAFDDLLEGTMQLGSKWILKIVSMFKRHQRNNKKLDLESTVSRMIRKKPIARQMMIHAHVQQVDGSMVQRALFRSLRTLHPLFGKISLKIRTGRNPNIPMPQGIPQLR